MYAAMDVDELGLSSSGNTSPHTRELTLLRIKSSNLCFGCLEAVIEGTNVPASCEIFQNRRQRLIVILDYSC